MTGLADCTLDRWSPGLGDPGLMGWATVAVYLAAALAAAAAAGGPFPARTRSRERLFWMLAAALLLLLAVNKQLDLQSALTAAAKCLAEAQGWYKGRRVVQLGFILAVAAGGVAVLLLLFGMLRGTLRRTGAALLGLGFVAGFVIIRAAGFHHVDGFIHSAVGGVRLNWALELPGPVLVLANALWLRARARRGG